MLKYITLLLEKQNTENIAMFLKALLGEEDDVQRTMDQVPELENMLKTSSQKVSQVLHSSDVLEKKDVVRFFKWSVKNGKILEGLRLSLTQ